MTPLENGNIENGVFNFLSFTVAMFLEATYQQHVENGNIPEDCSENRVIFYKIIFNVAFEDETCQVPGNYENN